MKRQLMTVAATAGILLTSFNGSASAHEKIHTVKSGDTLWQLSQTYNVTISNLMTWNKLSNSTIYVNQNLSVLEPHSHEIGTVVSSTYVVKSGDTLWGISKSYGLTVTELKSMNGLSSDLIRIGQVLKVTGTEQASTTNTVTTEETATTATTYTVKSGDSLSVIGARYGVTVTQLKSINHLSSDLIYPGQVLKLSEPANTETTVSTETQVKAVSTSTTTSSVTALLNEAKKYIGVPYVWGGSSPSGFDCSGYLNYVFNKVGVSIPRTVATIWTATKAVSTLKAGDIVFFETYQTGPSHAGIYLGNNQFIHAGSSRGVEISDMNNSYWTARYLGAKTAF